MVAFEGRLRIHCTGSKLRGVGEVAGVKITVAKEVVQLAVPFVRAATRCNVHDGTGIAAVLGTECLIVDLGLGHCIDGRLKGDLVLNRIAQVHAVDHVVDAVLAATRAVKGE